MNEWSVWLVFYVRWMNVRWMLDKWINVRWMLDEWMNVRWMLDEWMISLTCFFMLDLFDRHDLFSFFSGGSSIKLWSSGMNEWQKAQLFLLFFYQGPTHIPFFPPYFTSHSMVEFLFIFGLNKLLFKSCFVKFSLLAIGI